MNYFNLANLHQFINKYQDWLIQISLKKWK